MDNLSIPWSILIHPNEKAIKLRDEILLNAPDYIQNQDGSITAEIEIDINELFGEEALSFED